MYEVFLVGFGAGMIVGSTIFWIALKIVTRKKLEEILAGDPMDREQRPYGYPITEYLPEHVHDIGDQVLRKVDEEDYQEWQHIAGYPTNFPIIRQVKEDQEDE